MVRVLRLRTVVEMFAVVTDTLAGTTFESL